MEGTQPPQPEITEKPLYEFKLGDVELHFRSLDEFGRWAGEELTAWQWLEQAAGIDTNLAAVKESQLGNLQILVKELRRGITSEDKQAKAAAIEIAQQVVRAQAKNRYVVSTSPAGKFVTELAKSDPLSAAHALRYFQRLPAINQAAVATRGQTLAVLFEQGMSGSALPEKQALDALRGEFQATLEQLRADAGRKSDEYKALKEELEQEKATNQEAFATAQEVRTSKFENAIGKAAEDLKRLTKTYDDEMALRGAVTYWTKKGKMHRGLSWAWGVASLVLGAGFGVALWFGAHQAFIDAAGKSRALEYWELAVLFVLGTLVFWFLRILVRMTLSNVHLATDARMRATMMTVYLALRRRGNLEENDRRYILEVLFRPAISGIIKDDAMTPGVWDVVSRMANK